MGKNRYQERHVEQQNTNTEVLEDKKNRVLEFLETIKMENYFNLFTNHGFDSWEAFILISEEDYSYITKDENIRRGDWKLILSKLECLTEFLDYDTASSVSSYDYR